MAKLTIIKYFGEKAIMKYNSQFPRFLKIKQFLIENQVCNRTMRAVLKQLGMKWDSIVVKRKTARAKNGDAIIFTDLKQLKRANLEKSIREKEKGQDKAIIDPIIKVFRCQFVKMGYVNSIKDAGSIIVRLENGESRELLGEQRTINHLPIEDLIASKELNNSSLIIHYKNQWDWAIEPPNALGLIRNAINKG